MIQYLKYTDKISQMKSIQIKQPENKNHHTD